MLEKLHKVPAEHEEKSLNLSKWVRFRFKIRFKDLIKSTEYAELFAMNSPVLITFASFQRLLL